MSAYATRFLRLIGLPRRRPSLAYLTEIVERHQQAVAYENLSKLDRFARGNLDLPKNDEYLDGIEKDGLGGTCYTINSFFQTLLRDLGFAAELVGGSSNDGVNNHLSVRVTVDSNAYAIDLGYMLPDPGPFLLSGPEIAMPSGVRTYKFIPRGDGRNYRLQLARGDMVGRSFESVTEAKTLADFAESMRQSFDSDKLFMKTLCVHRKFGDHFRTVWGYEFFKGVGSEVAMRTIVSHEDLVQTLRVELGVTHTQIAPALAVLARHAANVD